MMAAVRHDVRHGGKRRMNHRTMVPPCNMSCQPRYRGEGEGRHEAVSHVCRAKGRREKRNRQQRRYRMPFREVMRLWSRQWAHNPCRGVRYQTRMLRASRVRRAARNVVRTVVPSESEMAAAKGMVKVAGITYAEPRRMVLSAMNVVRLAGPEAEPAAARCMRRT